MPKTFLLGSSTLLILLACHYLYRASPQQQWPGAPPDPARARRLAWRYALAALLLNTLALGGYSIATSLAVAMTALGLMPLIPLLPQHRRMAILTKFCTRRAAEGSTNQYGEAALQSACDVAVIGRRLLLSDNLLLDAMLGVALLEQNVRLLAAMRAELPADAPLPATCDELQPLANVQLALAAQMYGEWRFFMSGEAEAVGDWMTVAYSFVLRHLPRYSIRGFTRYAAPEVLTAVARGEVAVPPRHPVFDFCAPRDGLCRLTTMDDYQARLLNVNRYLAAFATLRDPVHLPKGMRRDGAFLYLELLPTQRGVQTLVLPLPGSQAR